MKSIGPLPSLAGKILRRHGNLNRLDIDDICFIARIEKEQRERTTARKLGQIKRAQKKKQRGLTIEPSVLNKEET